MCALATRVIHQSPSPRMDKKTRCIEAIASTLDMSVGSYVDPTLFGIMGGLALMFIVMIVVLRLFAKAQFQDNRTIFNTPNARLMNASVMKERALPPAKPNFSPEDQDVFETDLKARDIALERRARKKNSNSSRTSATNIEGRSNTSSQAKRKQSGMSGNSNNLTTLNERPEPSTTRKSISRGSTPSPFEFQDVSSNASTSRKSSDLDKYKQRSSSVTNPDKKYSKEKSCTVGIEKSS